MVRFTQDTEDDEGSSMYLPIGKTVSLPKGTALEIEWDETDVYEDNSSTFLLNYVINGEKIRYDNFDGSDVSGDFFFGKYRKDAIEEYIVKYDLSKPFGNGGEKLTLNEDGSFGAERIFADISRDGVLTVSGLSDGCVYDLRPVQIIEKEAGRTQYSYAGRLRIVCADLTNAEYPLVQLESGLVTADGGSYFYHDDETVGAILENDANVVYDVTPSGVWTDDEGTDVTDRPAKELASDSRRTLVYAVYEDYDIPEAERPELTEMEYINTEDDLHYSFADGTPVKDAFIQKDSDIEWIYLDSEGEPVSERLIAASEDTPWYVYVDYGTSHGTTGAYLKTNQEEGGVYYLNDPRNSMSLAREEWKEIQPDEIQADGAKLPAWYYFGGDGRAVSGDVEINNTAYRFDDNFRCVLPGWNESLGTDGEAGALYFADNDFSQVGTAFAAGDETFGEAGKYYYLKKGVLDAGGEMHEVSVSGTAKLYQTTPGEAEYEGPSLPVVKEGTMPGQNDSAAGAKNYYLIDADGRMLRNTWNEEKTKYYGEDGRAYRNGTFLIDGESYTFDKNGEVKEEEDIEEEKLPAIGKKLAEKLKNLHVQEETANTEEDAGEFVYSYINEYAGLPAGITVASVSTAQRSDVFRAAKDGSDGYWFYNVTLIDENEEIASSSSARRRSGDAVEIATGSTVGRKNVTIKNNKLIIDAKASEKPEPSAELAKAADQIRTLLQKTMLRQADGNKHFLKAQTGSYAQNEWAKVDGKWYYFNDKTDAVKGWNLIDGKWYFLNETDHSMQTGWHEDNTDGNWYLLNANGTLATGWVQIAGKFYFLNNASEGATYTQNADGSWTFNGRKNLPYGAMYKDGITPDGYRVGPDGAWDGLPRQSR